MHLKIKLLAISSRKKADGTIPIYCQLNLHKDVYRHSTGLSVLLPEWDKNKYKVKSQSNESTLKNLKLEAIIKEIKDAELFLIRQRADYNIQDILDIIRGKRDNISKTLLECYKIRFNQISSLIGIDYHKSTVSKYAQLCNAVRSFLIEELKVDDITLNQIKRHFIDDLERFLKVKKKMKQISINKVTQSLKSIIRFAQEREWIEKNPFIGHRAKGTESNIVFLTNEQIAAIESYHFQEKRLERVRQIFLFSIYTGLHFSDAMSLRSKNIIKGADGNNWIEYVRQKTSKKILIPLLDKAKKLLLIFSSEVQDYIIPRISNQKMNKYLKEISSSIGIEVNLTHKIARKTFGSMLLSYDIPIKIVSELMGHSSTLITERHYAKLDNRKLGEAINSLNTN